MQNVYSNISPHHGPHYGGICNVKICPREWLADYLQLDFYSGKIVDSIVLAPGRDLIDLDFLQDSYEYIEKPKSGKPGSFYEMSLSGNINQLDGDTLQTLNTYRYHEFIALVKDRQGRYKLVGNKEAGLVLQFGNKETNDKGGSQVIAIDMNMDLERPAPFYAGATYAAVKMFDGGFGSEFG